MLKLQSYGNKGKNELVWGEPGNKFFQEITRRWKLSQEEACEGNEHCVHNVLVHALCQRNWHSGAGTWRHTH